MVHSTLAFPSRRVLFSACVLAWMAAACSSGDSTGSHDAAEEDVQSSGDSAGVDVQAIVDSSSHDGQTPIDGAGHDGQSGGGDARVDGQGTTEGGGIDAAAHDAGMDAPSPPLDAGIDAHAPAAPHCNSADRTEWSGAIPNTVIAVSVCSTCGKSYVVAANGGESTAQVTVNNGSNTITTNVPAGGTATSAQIADNPSNGRVTVCGTSGTHGCLPVSPQNQRYCDPVRALSSLVPERIDQGVDYAGSGPIYAVGPGTINVYHNRDDSGWPGGTFVSYSLTAGPAAGKDIYLAENINLNGALHLGSFVFSGTVLGTLVDAYPNSETGWGVVGGAYTAEHACYVEGCSTALGINFNHLLTCLHAPSGILGSTGCCTSSMGYPGDWCTLLSQWQ